MADFAYRPSAPMANDRWLSSRRWGGNLETNHQERSIWQLTADSSPIYSNTLYSARFETGSTPSLPQSVSYTQGPASAHNMPPTSLAPGGLGQLGRASHEASAFSFSTACSSPLTQGLYTNAAPIQAPFKGSWGWDQQSNYSGNNQGHYQGRYSPSDSMDELGSPSVSDYSLDNAMASPAAPSSKSRVSPGGGGAAGGGGGGGRPRSQRRPSNRDEFDGPHQFLKRPPAEYIALQERELPRLPTHLLVQEQDSVLNQVNDRLSQCAYDFVAKYQFPIPLTQDMRPVERPQDREWTEWVYLLKRLATKRRIPARVLYNGQIKQFVTILENSLEMRHAAKHQSRPLKDDRNILQLISAGIQVAKILKDAQAMDYLDRLYVSTERRIQERVAAAAAASAAVRFR